MSKRIIVITGVSKGLGRALTSKIIESGATVAGCARSSNSIADLRDQFGSPHQFDTVDVADHSAVESWAQHAVEQVGTPDLLINCAALINRNAPLWQVPQSEFSEIVDVNIKGTYNTIAHFVPKMVKRGSGIVVNFSSYWGRSTSPDVAAYCASKWAIEGLSRGLADDLPDGMASVAFNPGIIHTDMLDKCFAEGAASYPTPQQWAESAAPYLLSLCADDNGKSVTCPGF